MVVRYSWQCRCAECEERHRALGRFELGKISYEEMRAVIDRPRTCTTPMPSEACRKAMDHADAESSMLVAFGREVQLKARRHYAIPKEASP